MKARQEPTFEQVGDYAYTDGPMAARLASGYFGEPLPWQRHFLDVMLARDEADGYAFREVGQACARQNGKSWDVRARCFYGLVASGESILYTCQLGDTADEMFSILSAPFQDEDEEELCDLLESVRLANGQQSITLKNGGYLRCTTRTGKLGRGRSYDVVIYDEAQNLTRSQQAATLPTVAAGPHHNSQVIYIGTPPEPDTNGFVFEGIHKRVHEGALPGMAWLEWAVDEVGDVRDRTRWYETNPSLGVLVQEEAIEAELTMDPADFARERLGWWNPVVGREPAIDEDGWAATSIGTIGNAYRRKTALAVRFSPDGSGYAVAGAKCNARGEAAFELVEVGDSGRGTEALATALWKRRFRVACVVIDGQAGAGATCDRLAELGCPKNYVVRPTSAQVVSASKALADAVEGRSVRHTSDERQPALGESARTSTRRPVGRDGGWAFGGECPEPIQACALALWGLRTTKRDPRRRQRLI